MRAKYGWKISSRFASFEVDCFSTSSGRRYVLSCGGDLVRAERMKAADTPASVFATTAPGAHAKAVVRLDQVVRKNLKDTILERESDTVYRSPVGKSPTVAALTPETSVVMGEPEGIVAGAIVPLAGTLDNNHVLRTNQVAILTGYVRQSEGAR